MKRSACDTCQGRWWHILRESSYSAQIKSVRKLHDKLITFRRSDKSVFYRILAAERPVSLLRRFLMPDDKSESGFTYFNEKLQNILPLANFLFPLFSSFVKCHRSTIDEYLKYFQYSTRSNYVVA